MSGFSVHSEQFEACQVADEKRIHAPLVKPGDITCEQRPKPGRQQRTSARGRQRA
jgi:hypothetical protein